MSFLVCQASRCLPPAIDDDFRDDDCGDDVDDSEGGRLSLLFVVVGRAFWVLGFRCCDSRAYLCLICSAVRLYLYTFIRLIWNEEMLMGYGWDRAWTTGSCLRPI